MLETTAQRQYRRDAEALGEIGADVRLPTALARLAVEAWERDDEGALDPESYEQRVQRHRAGTLALIGLAVSELGRPEGDEVVVALYPEIIGSAVGASDDLPSTP